MIPLVLSTANILRPPFTLIILKPHLPPLQDFYLFLINFMSINKFLQLYDFLLVAWSAP